ncbi:D-alanyl-D-alanine carboxypeptidase/D-alanyl-D-alanine-endopeptidase [Bacillus sp. PS06]|uniref:D-alanyl-D-alanine carboxypeptidase/D-alanyl-D-alanine endopeptidase n=1 Tax=Bacillus sp. PS06 TaxID=2764176 RepID=UPI00178403AE|nr:D-alanyl-D-alanine carboxypeptidase/D-alanyl-D-alanine-endopeptidase [Bacillus sp. PS06]MBD8067985.1 D-alanyl-D-alanine carboxypeptidase/D-alanyl-D-alanine-endopeptidase [Bacillus sp. PS06]
MHKKPITIALSVFFLILLVSIYIHFYKANDVQAFEEGNDLTKTLNQMINKEPQLQGSLTGVSIRSAKTGEILYEHIGDTRLRPASNLKLFTSAAALSVLGKDYRFKTQLLTDGKIKNETLNGNLYIKGNGDPTLLKEDLDKMVKELHEHGIKKVNGNLIGDDTYYDSIRYSVDLPWSDETTYYGAQISALTVSPDKDYDAGTIIVEVSPGKKVNDEAIVKLSPATDYLVIKNETKTIENKGKHLIKIEREHGENIIHVTGTIPLKGRLVKEWVSVWEPTNYVVHLLASSLQSNEIEVKGNLKTGVTPNGADLLVDHQSMTLSNLLVPFMKLSNNGHGETLVKAMGKVKNDEGTWESGIEIVNNELTNLGINSDKLLIRDGSGISHVNLVTPNEVTNLLYLVQSKPWFDHYLDSLPVSGFNERLLGGTLRYRLTSPTLLGKVRAKTGTITSVSSLSGYLETKTGETLIFSIILNNLLDESIGKKIEDQMINTIYEHYE